MTNIVTTLHPHHEAAERAVLGGLVQRPDLLAGLELDAADLWRPEHRALLMLLREMRRDRRAIDPITVPESVIRLGPERFGGVGYVMDLIEQGAPSAIGPHVRSIQADAERRRLMALAQDLLSRASGGTEEPGEIVADLTAKLRASSSMRAGTGLTTWREAIERAAENIQARMDKGATGVSTGFHKLDQILGGLCPGRLYVLAGRPKMGKSAVAQHMVEHVAAHSEAVLTSTMEMGAEELGERSIVAGARLNAERVRMGHDLSADQWERFFAHVDAFRDLPIYVQDRSGLRLSDIEGAAYRLGSQRKLGLVAIDYLQLMSRHGDNDVRALGDITRGLKSMARDLGVPVLLLSQLSRGVEAREDKRPRLSDLRGSGEIEQDADAVLFVLRPGYYDEAAAQNEVHVIVAAQRNGPTGTAVLKWDAGRVWE